MGREWTKLWIAVFILVNVLLVGYNAYKFWQGYRGVKSDVPTYNLLAHPSWLNFKIWFAAMANDPWTDILLMFSAALLPIPLLPAHVHNRFEVVLAKLGIYKMLQSAVLGPANYNPYLNFSGVGEPTFIIGWVFVGMLVVIAAYSWACKHDKLPGNICLPL